MTVSQPFSLAPARIAVIDLARTAALVGMVVFHTTYDLAMFRHIPAETPYVGVWPLLARLVAGSFLFLAGVSLWLAHGRGIRWPAFLRRLAILVVAALGVTVGTYFGVGATFVRFGILHSIALCSVIGLLFLRLPVAVTLAVAVAAFLAPWFLRTEALSAPWLLWLGLAPVSPPMVDYVPLLPWLAPFLAGLALARILAQTGTWPRLAAKEPPGPALRWLSWPGRHSLAIYLLHQPVIFGLIWAATMLMR